MGGTESNVSRDANISGTHTHTFPNSNLKLQLILWVVRVLYASNSYWVTVSLWGIVSGFNLIVSCQLMILCGRIPLIPWFEMMSTGPLQRTQLSNRDTHPAFHTGRTRCTLNNWCRTGNSCGQAFERLLQGRVVTHPPTIIKVETLSKGKTMILGAHFAVKTTPILRLKRLSHLEGLKDKQSISLRRET